MTVAEPQAATGLRGELLAVLPSYIVARVLVGVSFVLSRVITEDTTATEVNGRLVGWDGQWYRSIADVGYDGTPLEGVRFFPLYPYLARVVGWVVRDLDVALVLVSNAAALAVAVLIRRLVIFETDDVELADRSVWVVTLFPASFVLVWGYSESLMLVGAVGALLAMRQQRWWAAAAFGLVAGASRPLGLFVALPALIEAARAPREKSIPKLAAIAGPAIGTGSFLLWASVHFDDFLIPLTVQDDLRGEPTNPATRLFDGFGDLFGTETFGDGLHLPFALLFIGLLIAGVRQWPISYSAFAGIVLITSLAADNLNSLERYGLNAFPLLLTLAVLSRRWRLDRETLTISAAGMVSLGLLAILGEYVP